MFKNKTVLLGVTGGIAAYKAAAIASRLKKEGADVQVIMTRNAAEFITPLTFETLTGNPVITDTFKHEDRFDVAHVTLAKKTDFALIAPATANIIAKMALGIADDMMSTTYLALKCPVFVAPAMNTAMYENKAVQHNVEIIKACGCHIIDPEEGVLACGDVGLGRMAEPGNIIEAIRQTLALNQDYMGIPMLVTAGATVENIDPVRFITNRSSGKMGYSIAAAAQRRGAQVTLVSGPVSITPPNVSELVQVTTAGEMFDAVMQKKNDAKIIIKCAAVADYAPVRVAPNKMKKGDKLTLELTATRDILKELGSNKTYFLVGFAAETENLLENARKKLADKNLDMIVANDVSGQDIGFDSDNNAAVLIKKGGEELQLKAAPKEEIAQIILNEIIKEYKGF